MGTMIYAIGIGIVFGIFKYLEDKNDWRSWTLEWRLWDMIFKKLHRKQRKKWISVQKYLILHPKFKSHED